jgi:hypothetical protein
MQQGKLQTTRVFIFGPNPNKIIQLLPNPCSKKERKQKLPRLAICASSQKDVALEHTRTYSRISPGNKRHGARMSQIREAQSCGQTYITNSKNKKRINEVPRSGWTCHTLASRSFAPNDAINRESGEMTMFIIDCDLASTIC